MIAGMTKGTALEQQPTAISPQETVAQGINVANKPAQATPGISDQAAGAGIAAAQSAVNIGSQIAQAKKEARTQEYLTDLNYWHSQGKPWFDPNTETHMDWAEYERTMPSAVQARKEGSVTGSPMVDSIGGRALLGAAAGAQIGFMVGLPAGGIGAIPAAKIGAALGLAVGGIAGLIEGIFGGSEAKRKDQKEKERAYNEYKQKIIQWTAAINYKHKAQKAIAVQKAAEKGAMAREIGYAAKAKQKASLAATREKNRQSMIDLFNRAGGLKQQARAARQARFAR